MYFILRKASKPIKHLETYRTWFCMLNTIFFFGVIALLVNIIVAEIDLFRTQDKHSDFDVFTTRLAEDLSN